MAYPELEKCIEIVKALRHPKTGCPWDLQQTHESLLKYLIEESFEFIDSVEKQNSKSMEEELGDVLFQVLLLASLGEERKEFNLETVAKNLADKLVRRHPHVFTLKEEKLTSEEVIQKWQEIKKTEKGEKKYSIDESYLHAPALMSAFKIGQKSTTVNFDWENHSQVLMKVEEELNELKEEINPSRNIDKKKIKEELGDLLFSVAQLARHLEINPEECLRDANKKFISRFQKVEDLVKASGRKLEETPQADLEEYWIKIKKR